MNQDQLKQAVADAAVDYVLGKINSNSIIGIGTGSTANCFIDSLAQHQDKFKGTVASSEASAQRLQKYGITVYDLNAVSELAIYIDGADECNAALELIKGGGAALTREKIVTAVAKEFVCIADESKLVATLGAFPLPVEVIPMARNYVMRELEKLGGKPRYRAGVITDNGNIIIDVDAFMIKDPKLTENQINNIVGVVTNGLFAARPADLLLLGTATGIKQLKAQ